MSSELNPYAPPAAPPSPPAARTSRFGTTWVYLGFSVIFVASLVASYVTASAGAHDALRPVSAAAQLGRLVAILAWIHAAWRSLPAGFRSITPARTVGLSLIPFYGVYWMARLPVRLCTALDAALAAAGVEKSSPRLLAIVTPVATLASVLFENVVAGTFVFARRTPPWLFLHASTVLGSTMVTALTLALMARCDATRQRVLENESRLPENTRTAMVAIPGAGCLVAWVAFALVLFAVLAIALWQFLAPAKIIRPVTGGPAVTDLLCTRAMRFSFSPPSPSPIASPAPTIA